jgi:hypothetical protein
MVMQSIRNTLGSAKTIPLVIGRRRFAAAPKNTWILPDATSHLLVAHSRPIVQSNLINLRNCRNQPLIERS